MKRVLPLLVITLFLAGIFIVPSVGLTTSARLQENTTNISESFDSEMLTADLPNDRVFKVALYNETNSTAPAYASGAMNANYSEITQLLVNAGYDVDIITVQNIQNYELTTANYDALVLADNCPRENITNLVKDFWLAGGGILGLDSSMSYLGYAGILYRENDTVDDGYNTFWHYNYNANGTIVTSHPVTHSYTNGTEVPFMYADWAQIDLTTFDSTTVWSQTTVLAVDPGDPDWAVAVAVDAYDRGGKVVQIGIPAGYWWNSAWGPMVVDAIGWLAPRPKARIAFDLSHKSHLYVDAWDEFSLVWSEPNSFSDIRDTYVSNRYTVDKFYPLATGNFTEARLAEYDILILDLPYLNYTVAERTALMAWLDAGGGLIVLGDRTGIGSNGYLHLNFLLEDLDMHLNSSNVLDYTTTTTMVIPRHPTTEGTTGIALGWRNYINITGPAAQGVWKYGNNIVIAAQEYGDGRVVMFGDQNILDNTATAGDSNKLYGINVANWLSADDAHILLYTDDPYGGSYYRNIVTEALNQLELSFYHISTEEGLNYTLNGTWYEDQWELVIIDNCNWGRQDTFPHILDYLKSGRPMILESWSLSWYPNDPLWSYIGVNSTGHYPSNQPLTIWDDTHPIFDGFVSYNAPTLNVSNAGFGTDGATLDVYDNATAIAGYTATEEDGNASIVVSNNGQILLNGYLLNNFRGDIDGSGYMDGFEIYMNEITYMLALPSIDHPADIQYEAGSSGNTITWNPADTAPSSYQIFIDGSVDASGSWTGTSITADVNDLSLGVHKVECRVVGDSGYPMGDIVLVTVVDTTAPLLNSPADITMIANTTGNTLTWVASDPNPDYYVILMNSTVYASGVWDGSSVVVDLDDLAPGVYFFTLRVNDTLGHMSEDSVLVTVNPPSLFGLDTTTLILIGLGVLAVLIIGAVVCRRRGASQPAPKSRKKK